MNTALALLEPPPHPTPKPTEQPDYRGALALALSAFGQPATNESSMARATAFVCYLAGAVKGHGDEDLGAAIFAIVRPPETTAAGAA